MGRGEDTQYEKGRERSKLKKMAISHNGYQGNGNPASLEGGRQGKER